MKNPQELFKGALELKLAIERSLDGGASIQKDEVAFVATQSGNSYIQRAEIILRNITNYTERIPSSRTMIKTPDGIGDCDASSPQAIHGGDSTVSYRSTFVDTMDGMYSPFIFCRPMRLPTNKRLPSRNESATIIFNLALVDHLKNRASQQAVQLYELAMTLLTGEVVDELGVALMNNIGAWCYENGDLEGTMTCIGHLSIFLGSCSGLLNEEQRDGLQANVLWMTNSSYIASPAA